MNNTVDSQVDYADLEIRILGRLDIGYPVELTLNGEQEFSRGYLAPAVLPWVASASPAEDGERLFRLLFADERVRVAWAEIRGQTPLRRVRLRIDESAPELHAIPWELLREVSPGLQPQTLAATVATPFSRDLAGQWRPVTPVEERPVKLLVAIANPDNLTEYSALQAIDVEAEKRSILSTLADMAADELELRFLTPPVTLSNLEGALKEGGDHILHIVAHGMYHPMRGRAILFLADAANRVVRVGEDAFAEMLARQRESLRLVFLASCQSAQRSPADAFRGFAPRLIAAGVPAVVAMQDLVPVKTARAFASTFYRQLLRHGLVDVAANEARSVLMSDDIAGSWAVPVLFSRVPEGRILAPPPPVEAPLPWWNRLRDFPPIARTLALIGSLISALTVLALVLDLSSYVNAAREPDGILHGVWPAPTATPTPLAPMPSGFNVAVAEFTIRDAAGRLVATDETRKLSAWLSDALKRETDQLPAELAVHLREPTQIGAVDGADHAARDVNAAQIAAQHNATVLIYGVITRNQTEYQFEPEFYINNPSFGYGSEINGSERLGKPVTFTFPLEPGIQAAVNAQLNTRALTLQRIIMGLAQFSIRKYDKAWAEFQDAAAIAPDQGKEVLSLLIGASKLRAYDPSTSVEQRLAVLDQAEQAFDEARRLNRDYARSYLGLGAVALKRAELLQSIDQTQLIKATEWFSDSLKASDQPPSAYVPIKAAYGLGQAHLLGLEYHLPGWSASEARRLLEQVIAAYTGDRAPDLMNYAGHAHADLGWLAGRDRDWPQMAAECRIAIGLLSSIPFNPPKDRVAQYWTWVALAEERQNHRDAAIAAYDKAIASGREAIDPKVDPRDLANWQAQRARLAQGG